MQVVSAEMWSADFTFLMQIVDTTNAVSVSREFCIENIRSNLITVHMLHAAYFIVSVGRLLLLT